MPGAAYLAGRVGEPIPPRKPSGALIVLTALAIIATYGVAFGPLLLKGY